MADNIGLSVTRKQFEEDAAPMALDLVALFKIMEEAVQNKIAEANQEGWTPERLIQEIEAMI